VNFRNKREGKKKRGGTSGPKHPIYFDIREPAGRKCSQKKKRKKEKKGNGGKKKRGGVIFFSLSYSNLLQSRVKHALEQGGGGRKLTYDSITFSGCGLQRAVEREKVKEGGVPSPL